MQKGDVIVCDKKPQTVSWFETRVRVESITLTDHVVEFERTWACIGQLATECSSHGILSRKVQVERDQKRECV